MNTKNTLTIMYIMYIVMQQTIRSKILKINYPKCDEQNNDLQTVVINYRCLIFQHSHSNLSVF